ncbi:hypothetical protein [Ruegeria sp. 6PALISEP08]|uniref:hypothetical protein n=1 Tax=Ruegeria sp. 6PALISEP08 TaxID=1225660 RepID=UPI00067F4C43|nr:hypothetical protein [Ruegeria sp. 6PALISEP08]
MSDDEGGNGIIEDAIAATHSKTWETRLKEAREKRAGVLAEAKPDAREPPRLKPAEIDLLPPADEAEIDEIVSERVRSLNLDEPRGKRTSRSRVVAVVAALFCGAFLHWVATQVFATWQATSEPSVAQTKGSVGPTETNDVVLPEIASAALLPKGPTESEPKDPAPKTLLETKTKALADDTEDPPDKEIAISFTPPVVFLPVSLAPVSEDFTPQITQVSLSTSVAPQILNPNHLKEKDFSNKTHVVFDPLPHEVTVSAAPPYAEVKPLISQKSFIDLDVSLFVPGRVSEDVSNRVLELLTRSQANVVATARVGYRVRETQVRFYHPDDAENASLAAQALGGVARDFTASGSKTRPGRIEVYLAGSGGGANRTAQQQPTGIETFIERLLNELR